jgi:hypothetical protein
LVIGWRPGKSAIRYTGIVDWDQLWGFEPAAVAGIEASGASFVSPDGRLQLVQQFLNDAATEVAGLGASQWPAVELHQLADPDPEWSMLSASLSHGDLLTPYPWLADGTGFLVMTRSDEQGRNDLVARQYAIVSRNGLTVTPLPVPGAGEPSRAAPSPSNSPTPCPYDPDLIAFGRLQVYSRRTGETLTANIASGQSPDHLDPWAAGPGQMVFALPHVAHGGGSPSILLPPKRTAGALPTRFRFVVARTGDGLNLRTGGHTGTDVIGVIPDGTVVELAEDVKMPVGQRSAVQNEEGTWLYVRTPAGAHGWVSAAYLDWE